MCALPGLIYFLPLGTEYETQKDLTETNSLRYNFTELGRPKLCRAIRKAGL